MSDKAETKRETEDAKRVKEAEAMVRKEAEWVATQDCYRRCFLACYLEVERYIRNPLSLLKESSIRTLLFGTDRSPNAS